MEKLKKCHICGNYEHQEAAAKLSEEEFDKLEDKLSNEITECEHCGQQVCDADDSETCGEIINYDQTWCNDCIKKLGKTDCGRCKTLSDDCWCGREYAYIVGDCPDFNDEEPKGDDDNANN